MDPSALIGFLHENYTYFMNDDITTAASTSHLLSDAAVMTARGIATRDNNLNVRDEELFGMAAVSHYLLPSSVATRGVMYHSQGPTKRDFHSFRAPVSGHVARGCAQN